MTQILLVSIAVLLGGLTSARASWVLGEKWNLSKRSNQNPSVRDVMTTVAFVGAAIIVGFAANYAFEAGGWLYGVIADFLAIPFAGAIWMLIVGGNKVVETFLNGIDVRLSAE